MGNRVHNNDYNVWSCSSCRKEEYHLFNTEKKCVVAEPLDHCDWYSQEVEGYAEVCIRCKFGYYIHEGRCLSCSTTETHCFDNNYDQEATSATLNGKCQCKVCQEDYFLGQDGSCSHISNHDHGCLEYKDTECLRCHD